MHSIRSISHSSATSQRFAGAAERRDAAAKRRSHPTEASIYLSQFYGRPDAHDASTDVLSVNGQRSETSKASKTVNGQPEPAHHEVPVFGAKQPKPNTVTAQPSQFLKLTSEPSEALVKTQELNEALQQRVRELELQVSNLKSRGVFSRLFNLSK